MDLSAPEDASINDGIRKELCSLTYVSIDAVVDSILALGRGALVAKVDVMQAYHNVPVHPEDRHLLAVRWKDELFIDKVLPFGLRSAPLIFTALADALQWIVEEKGVKYVWHYLDDFITVGPPASEVCAANLNIIEEVCKHTGMPLEAGKREGPATTIQFLGMELDTDAMVIRLPKDKLEQLRKLLADWKGRKAVIDWVT